MIAALPMYDRPENRAAHDAFWDAVRAKLGDGPRELTRDMDYDATWAQPDLLLGQICNLPYRARFRGKVTRIAASDYGLPDTPPGYYHSVFITRLSAVERGLAPATLGTFAYNDALSQSGWGAPLASVTEKGLRFHSTLATGSHAASAQAVAEGRADLAALDAVTWRNMVKWDDVAAELGVVGRTGLSPGMTFITAPRNDPEPILNALREALAALPPEHCETLGLRNVVPLPDAAYGAPLPDLP